MSLDVGRYRLFNSHKNLQERWDETRLYWHDVVRQDFARQHLAALEPSVSTTPGAIDRLAQILNRIRQECS